jgi:1-acyl-sn-glycerol-3-phosphate acyltransferase
MTYFHSYLYSIYVYSVGAVSFGIILISGIFMSFFSRIESYDPMLKKMFRCFFKILFIKVDAQGSERIDKNKTYLFMSNHVSIFDVPLLGGYIPGTFRGVAAHHQFKWPLYGWALKRYGTIPIERDNIHRSIFSLKKAEKYLARGRSIAILPEGHRTLDGKLKPFKKLPFFLAKQAGLDIVPIGISGLYRLKPKGRRLIRRTNLKIKFGDIIPYETVNSLSVDELSELTRNKIQGLIE